MISTSESCHHTRKSPITSTFLTIEITRVEVALSQLRRYQLVLLRPNLRSRPSLEETVQQVKASTLVAVKAERGVDCAQ